MIISVRWAFHGCASAIFTVADNANGQLVALVNHKFGDYYWPHQDPIGIRLRVGSLKMLTLLMSVVQTVPPPRLHRNLEKAKPLTRQKQLRTPTVTGVYFPSWQRSMAPVFQSRR